MIIVIERNSEEPLYEQIAKQIRERVAEGVMLPGTPLPPVRSLASDLGVNLNTVARAYRLLEEQGFLSIRNRSGAEVAPPSRRPRDERLRLVQELRQMLARLHQAGLSRQELQELALNEIRLLADRPVDS